MAHTKRLQPLKRTPYSNWRVLNQEGELLFRCSDKKAKWYLEKNLAIQLMQEKTIALIFKNKGIGRIGDDYYLQDKQNICVVCGTDQNLTLHHIVPYCYRKYFPVSLKSKQSYDIQAVCVECHEKYEPEADKLKQKLKNKYNAKDVYEQNKELQRIAKIANALLNHKDKIPPEKIIRLENEFKKFTNKNNILEEDLFKYDLTWADTYKLLKSHLQTVVESLTDLDEFCIMWRKHFIEYTRPKFLPEFWDVNRKIMSERQNESSS